MNVLQHRICVEYQIRGAKERGIVSMKMMMMVMRCLIRFGNLVARRRTGGIVHGVGKIIWGGFH